MAGYNQLAASSLLSHQYPAAAGLGKAPSLMKRVQKVALPVKYSGTRLPQGPRSLAFLSEEAPWWKKLSKRSMWNSPDAEVQLRGRTPGG